MTRAAQCVAACLSLGGALLGGHPHGADTPGPRPSAPAVTQIMLADTPIFNYPHGYYFPAETVTVSGYNLADFALPLGRVSLMQIDTDERTEYSCEPLIRADTVDVECAETFIGSISLHGHFTPLIRDWEHQNLLDGIILSGELVIASRGEVMFSKKVNFHFWEGD